jgi:hypothetical protein
MSDVFECPDCGYKVQPREFPASAITMQKQIVENVKARGYWEGLPAWAIACRQMPKLVEEVCEIAEPVDDAFSGSFSQRLLSIHGTARSEFRDMEGWQALVENLDPEWLARIDWQKMLEEAFDAQVVLCNFVAAIMEHTNGDADQDCDLMLGALRKSEADISRGTK